MAVSNKIFPIRVPLPGNPLKAVNAWLVKGDERDLLIDTGFNLPESEDALKKALSEYGVETAKLDILLTHLHCDHSGLAAAIKSESSIVYSSKKDGDLIDSLCDPAGLWPNIIKNLERNGFQTKELEELNASHPGRLYANTAPLSYHYVNDGDILSYGGMNFRVIETPGHTPGHIVLYEPQQKILIAGDHILPTLSPNITTWPDVPDSLQSYLESLDKIAKLETRLCYPGHGEIFSRVAERCEELQMHHHQRLEEVTQIVAALGKVNAWQTAAHMKWHSRSAWTDWKAAQKSFAVSEASAHLEHLAAKKVISKFVDRSGKIFFGVQTGE